MYLSVPKWTEVLSMDVIQDSIWLAIEKAPPVRTVFGLLPRHHALILTNVLQSQVFVPKKNVLTKLVGLNARKRRTVSV